MVEVEAANSVHPLACMDSSSLEGNVLYCIVFGGATCWYCYMAKEEGPCTFRAPQSLPWGLVTWAQAQYGSAFSLTRVTSNKADPDPQEAKGAMSFCDLSAWEYSLRWGQVGMWINCRTMIWASCMLLPVYKPYNTPIPSPGLGEGQTVGNMGWQMPNDTPCCLTRQDSSGSLGLVDLNRVGRPDRYH